MIATPRHSQIIRLLETRDDHLPQTVRRDAARLPGFVHNTSVRETCTDCLSNDKTMNGCETCGGRGYTETVRARDPYAIDKVQPYGMTGDRHQKRRERDAELSRLAAQTRAPWTSEQDELADANQHPYLWEIERARKWRDYDYRALDVALEQLRQHDQGAYQLLHSVYVYGWQDSSVVVEAAVQRGLGFLDAKMPDPLRAPGVELPAVAKESLWRGKSERHAQRREARVGRVVRAHRDWGWTVGQIAEHESLTKRRVQQLLVEYGQIVASGPAA